eukprot:Plantae.Rhodophyta-Hildenbrandia_rubra.ctg1364.p1 GENE.Plantae.Rhodophyta-Hildenbrandia_rubra.ctg1364~~Plantae.Rhodophyta-Hildenbrandia_rubra.ctg1364.p1  ORF type:complete len:1197 (-),score=275.11 Plantae.Rhodophyta-Hildenbrandia_rubra.ctg1364:106-3696(-)
MAWGDPSSEAHLTGASGRVWDLSFERRLSPRGPERIALGGTDVHVVRDAGGTESGGKYVVKRVLVDGIVEVEELIDEAAVWRRVCVGGDNGGVLELVDVFVDRGEADVLGGFGVAFLMEFAEKGHVRKGEGWAAVGDVLESIVKALISIREVGVGVHGNVEYWNVLKRRDGTFALGGWGKRRIAIVRDNPGLNFSDDVYDVGLLAYTLLFNRKTPKAPEEIVFDDDTVNMHPKAVIALIQRCFDPVPDRPDLDELLKSITAAKGGVTGKSSARSTVTPILGSKPTLTKVLKTNFTPTRVSTPTLARNPLKPAPVNAFGDPSKRKSRTDVTSPRSLEAATERYVKGADRAFDDVLAAVKGGETGVIKMLSKQKLAVNPVEAWRCLVLLHRLMLRDTEDTILDEVRRGDKFMEWLQGQWSRESIESSKNPNGTHQLAYCFSTNEIAFYSSFLRTKARFHMLALHAFTGGWVRRDAVADEVLAKRARKIAAGMADVMEVAMELVVAVSQANDEAKMQKALIYKPFARELAKAYDAVKTIIRTSYYPEKVLPSAEKVRDSARKVMECVPATLRVAIDDSVLELEAKGTEGTNMNEIEDSNVEGEAGKVSPEGPPGDESNVPSSDQPRDIVAEEEKGDEEEDDDDEDGQSQEEEQSKAEEKESKVLQNGKNKEGAEVTELPAASKNDMSEALAAATKNEEEDHQLDTALGDLLSLDVEPEAPKMKELRPVKGMSDAEALAIAFGASDSAVAGRHLALPAPGDEGKYSDDDEEGGHFEEYQERMEEERQARENREDTGKWAERNYGNKSMGQQLIVAGQEGMYAGKPHPVFCQCAVCEEALKIHEKARGGASALGNGRLQIGEGRKEGRKHGQSIEDDYDSYESYDYDEPQRVPDDHSNDSQSAKAVPDTNRAGNTSRELRKGRGSILKTVDGKPVYSKKEFALNKRRVRVKEKLFDEQGGAVFRGTYDGTPATIKKVGAKKMKDAGFLDGVRKEVEYLCGLQSPCVVKCLGFEPNPPELILVTEQMDRGTLHELLHKNQMRLTWPLVKKMARQIAEAMRHLHSKGVAYCNLKSSTVAVDSSFNAKLFDFKSACMADDLVTTGNVVESPQCMAPEVLGGALCSEKSDVYSYALVIWEMVSGAIPFFEMEEDQVVRIVLHEGLRPPLPPHCLRPYQSLIQRCWTQEPIGRPTFTEILDILSKM